MAVNGNNLKTTTPAPGDADTSTTRQPVTPPGTGSAMAPAATERVTDAKPAYQADIDAREHRLNYGQYTGGPAAAVAKSEVHAAIERTFVSAGIHPPAQAAVDAMQNGFATDPDYLAMVAAMRALSAPPDDANKASALAAAVRTFLANNKVDAPQLLSALTNFPDDPSYVDKVFLLAAATDFVTAQTPADTGVVYIDGRPVVNSGNVWALLFAVLRESVVADNDDKRYFLGQLTKLNMMGTMMMEHLRELESAQQELSRKTKGKSASNAADTRVEFHDVHYSDFSSFDENGKMIIEDNGRWQGTSTDISNALKTHEQAKETLSNIRQQVTNKFQTADERTNQVFNELTSILKQIGDMMQSTTKNLS